MLGNHLPDQGESDPKWDLAVAECLTQIYLTFDHTNADIYRETVFFSCCD